MSRCRRSAISGPRSTRQSGRREEGHPRGTGRPKDFPGPAKAGQDARRTGSEKHPVATRELSGNQDPSSSIQRMIIVDVANAALPTPGASQVNETGASSLSDSRTPLCRLRVDAVDKVPDWTRLRSTVVFHLMP